MVNKNWITWILLPFLFFPYFFYAQLKETGTLFLKAQVHGGVILQHRNSMGHLIKGHITGLELNAGIPSTGRYLYEHENNFPEKGIAGYWFDLDNKDQLGQVYALAPYAEIPLHYKINPFTSHLRLALGLAYATQRFDPILNHKNNVISTRINGFVNFKFLWKQNICEKFRLDYGLSLMHASNGKFKVPNLGINLATFNLALVFITAQNKNSKFIKDAFVDSSTVRKSKQELLVGSALGITTVYPVGSPQYLAQTHSITFYYNKRNTNKFGGGIDIYHNEANKINNWEENGVRLSTGENIQLGLKACWAYNFGRISLPIEMGAYLISAYKGDGLFFHRIGARYYFRNNWVATFTLKAHWARADYFEYGLAYRFPLKRKELKK